MVYRGRPTLKRPPVRHMKDQQRDGMTVVEDGNTGVGLEVCWSSLCNISGDGSGHGVRNFLVGFPITL